METILRDDAGKKINWRGTHKQEQHAKEKASANEDLGETQDGDEPVGA